MLKFDKAYTPLSWSFGFELSLGPSHGPLGFSVTGAVLYAGPWSLGWYEYIEPFEGQVGEWEAVDEEWAPYYKYFNVPREWAPGTPWKVIDESKAHEYAQKMYDEYSGGGASGGKTKRLIEDLGPLALEPPRTTFIVTADEIIDVSNVVHDIVINAEFIDNTPKDDE